jgi:hypothetical protein
MPGAGHTGPAPDAFVGAAERGGLERRRAEMITGIPIWAIVLDYVLGTIMWTLIGRAAMNLFQPVNSDFFFMKVFVRATNPLLRFRQGRRRRPVQYRRLRPSQAPIVPLSPCSSAHPNCPPQSA